MKSDKSVAVEKIAGELVPTERLSPEQAKIQDLRGKMIDMLGDALNVLHTAVKGGKVTRTQVYASNGLLRFAPTLENEASGAVTLHFHVPRPPKGTVINAAKKGKATTLPRP